jgi:putative sigma-54 modulation protein
MRQSADVFANWLQTFLNVISILGARFMSLKISGHHLEVTPALQAYVNDKFVRINRHFDQVGDIKVLLSIENEKEKQRRQHAECSIHVKGHDFFAETAHTDLYAAVDLLVDKIDHQVAKHKTKVQNHHHVAAKRLIAVAD